MKVLHICWEFPPLVYGGLGRHVGEITAAQAAAGDEVVVVTQTEGDACVDRVGGVRAVRVPRDDSHLPFDEATLTAWVAGLESALTRAVAGLAAQWRPDIVHAHDWMVARTAMAARDLLSAPLVSTVHATEAGRHQGWLPAELSVRIHATEWLLVNNSAAVITCSQHMRSEVEQLFEPRAGRVSVVPNGIDLAAWRSDDESRNRMRARMAPDGPMLVHTGRIEWEKGLHTLLDAMPAIKKAVPGVRLVVAGRGGKADDARAQTARLGLQDCVTFLGWLSEEDLHALVACADAAVVPSLYEPFGLVALEAAALGTPVIAAASGGLAEFARDGELAVAFAPGDPVALAEAVTEVLGNPEATALRTARARAALADEYSWERVAELTNDVYRTALDAAAVRFPSRAPRGPAPGTRVLPPAPPRG